MLLAKIDHLARKICCVKKTLKNDLFTDFLTLEGLGRQTVETRSTSGLPLKPLGYDGSNGLFGRSVALKLSKHHFTLLFPRLFDEK